MATASDTSSAGPGFFRRLVRRLTTDVEKLDADDLSRLVERSGACYAKDCLGGQEVTLLGRLRSVELCPREAAGLQAELFDGTDYVLLVWLGRRKIPGIEPGRVVKARGRLAVREGKKVLYNPHYELQPAS